MRSGLWLPFALALSLLAVSAPAGHAILSLGGPTGLVSVPNAHVAAPGQLDLALGYETLEVQADAFGMYGPEEDYTIWQFQALRGVSDEAEVWAAYSSIDNRLDGSAWGFGGKWQFVRQPVAVAAGISYHTVDLSTSAADADTDAWKAYVVATKDLTPNEPDLQILGTVGLMFMDVDVSAPYLGLRGPFDELLTEPFLGVELVSAGGTTAGVEYRWDDDVEPDAVLSAMLRTPLSEGAFWEIGTTNARLVGLGSEERGGIVRVIFTTEF